MPVILSVFKICQLRAKFSSDVLFNRESNIWTHFLLKICTPVSSLHSFNLVQHPSRLAALSVVWINGC